MKADEATLARLMGAAQRGDRSAYSALLQASNIWLKRYFARRVAPAQIDDLCQEVLIAIHAKRASYDPGRAFLPWLAAIARYRWIDHLRRVYRDETQALTGDEAALSDDAQAIAARISLDRLFEQLSPAQATAIELVKIRGCSIRDAARQTGQSEPLVKVNIHRGLKKLSAMIEEAD